ncbi:MAG: hypothetical protein ABI634_10470 [Acidobacteriota bacterium]
MRAIRPFVLLVIAAIFASASAGLAQSAVTAADLTRLETAASEISTQVDALKKTDPTLAGDVSRSLADLNDEITYLKVKMRREGSVTRDEYAALRDRLETLRVKARGEKVSADPVIKDDPSSTGGGTVPAGTEFDVRLQTSLNSATAKIEERFEGATVLDYASGKTVVVPAGSTVRGFVSSVRAAGKLDRRAALTLSFDEIRIGNRSYRFRGSVTRAFDGKLGDDTARIGAGAAVGAIIGGILAGGKGALLGVLVGGGGTMAASDGTDVSLPAGTILRVRLDQALEIADAK